ncbi:hypothetical protein GCM10011349_31940 [Novosphingobium indicum]|uniref:Conjugal transfer protein TraN n=1 Tax=Novosphingobium indicum TaxID=462949 RepID=A0ABQ2JTS8_9SPHN|nr:conjugal transfer protein TraN [Novosphingobium indicum]GGN55369.1 hypothetical protein GCM10011349_31940 [Novosphingobium indicum]
MTGWRAFVVAVLLLAPVPGWAQADALKQGEDFAKSVRDAQASGAVAEGSENDVPGYGGTAIDASKYLDDPDGLTDAGISERYSNPDYGVVIDSSRPEFDPATIDLSTAQDIEYDPEAYVGTGLSAGGSTGNCEPLPNDGTTSSTYFETCNEGDQIITSTQTCTETLNVEVEKITTWVYYTADRGPYAKRSLFNSYVTSGTCQSKGTFSYCGNVSLYGYKAAGDCKDSSYSTEILECTQEISGLTAASSAYFTGIVPSTGAFWMSKGETVKPAVITRNTSACASFAGNAQCAEQGSEVCSDSDPVTRNINGVDVTQPCWAWTRTFQCTERKAANDCSELQANAQCTFDHKECLSENDDGSCNVYDDVYRCVTPASGTTNPQAYLCAGDLYCINGECMQVERQASTEFKDAMVAVQTMGDVRDQFDPDNLTLFNGAKEGCHKPVFGLVNCCAGKTSGLITTAAGAAAIAGGPTAIAALATPFLTMFLCSNDEKLLDVKDRMGLCHYVGTYCSDKILGVCTSKRKSYCCFESKLSRILQEQGRAQLAMSWGTAKNPDCEGFTVEEFQQLDLSQMDFTEVYDEFVDAAKVPDEVETSIEIQNKIEEYYKLHGGS